MLTQNCNNQYRGSVCYSNSILKNCPYTKLCQCDSSCVLWRSGKFSNPLDLSTSSNDSNLISSRTGDVQNIKYNTSSYNASLTADAQISFSKICRISSKALFIEGIYRMEKCKYPTPKSIELRRALVGRHLIFIGNSMIRQVFLRLLWECRGIDEIIEQGFHSSAFYQFNATHDYLGILGSPINGSVLPYDKAIVNPLFRMEYIWDPTGQYLGEG